MPKTTITVDTPIENCGIYCPQFKVIENKFITDGTKIWGTYVCANYRSCEEALYLAGVLKDAGDEEETKDE